MKTFILIAALACLTVSVQAQTMPVINGIKPTLFQPLNLSDAVKVKIDAIIPLVDLSAPLNKNNYGNMPVAMLSGNDKMPVYYSETNDRMAINLSQRAKSDVMKSNFLVPLPTVKVDMPVLPGAVIKP